MSTDMKVAVVGLVGAILGATLGAILGPITSHWLDDRESSPTRDAIKIMNTKWNATWLKPDGTLYAKDVVTFSNWTKDDRFVGDGDIVLNDKPYRYAITGEVAPNRVVILTYKAEQFPTQSSFGTVCLSLSGDGLTLTGYWLHRPSDALEVVAGKVTMTRI